MKNMKSSSRKRKEYQDTDAQNLCTIESPWGIRSKFAYPLVS
jgi:hypothetical protein